MGFFAQKEKLYFACGLSYAVIKRYAINNSRIFDLHDKKDGDTLNWNYYVLLLDGEGLRDKTSLVLSILETFIRHPGQGKQAPDAESWN